jgi:beta-xylosidase
MKDGDCAGLMLLQKKYGWIGVKMASGTKSIVVVSAESGTAVELGRVPLNQDRVYLKAECDFRNRSDKGYFYYSLDGKSWKQIDAVLQMAYTLPHFMGYRFGLFNYATQQAGGHADFDFFHITDKISDGR